MPSFNLYKEMCKQIIRENDKLMKTIYLEIFSFKYARNSPSLASSITIHIGESLQIPISLIICGCSNFCITSILRRNKNRFNAQRNKLN